VRDDGPPLFLQQFDQPPLRLHQRVDLGRLAVEEGGNGALFGRWRHQNRELHQIVPAHLQ